MYSMKEQNGRRSDNSSADHLKVFLLIVVKKREFLEMLCYSIVWVCTHHKYAMKCAKATDYDGTEITNDSPFWKFNEIIMRNS